MGHSIVKKFKTWDYSLQNNGNDAKKQIFSNTDILFTKETNINLFESAISDIRIQRPSRTHGKRNNLKSSLAAKIEIRKKIT